MANDTTSEKTVGTALDHPFRLGKGLPASLKSELQKLSGARALPFLGQLALAWVVMVAAITVAATMHRVWISAIAIVVIATRMNILGLLVHEQAHKLGIRGRKGDIITNLLAGYPLLALSVESYASIHLTHHKYYFTDKDPDLHRKSGEVWSVPKSKLELAKLFLRDLVGLSTIEIIRNKNKRIDSKEFARSRPTPSWARPLFFVALVGAITFLHAWPLFLLYWVLPIFTVLQVIVRWGALTEHIYDTPGMHIEHNSPLILTSRLDRILLPNLNFSFHAYHHWHASISFSLLPRVHALYVQHGLIDDTKVFHGYGAFLGFVLSNPQAEQHAVAVESVRSAA